MEVDEQGAGKPSENGGGGGKGSEGDRSEQENKLWATVTQNPSDFKSWTALLQLTEQNSVVGVVRETFSRFLGLYPFCYGYWKKYSELIRRSEGAESARAVLEESAAAIPLSIDLWLHYTSFAGSFYRGSPQAEEQIRSVYDRAVDSCGLDFRSTPLWVAYIGWETGGGRHQRVTALYDKLLSIPTRDLATHFENFKKLLETSPTSQMFSEEEYKEITSQAGDMAQGEAAFDGYVRKVTLERRTAMFERSSAELEKRKHFELMIKRPYFHVKPLERLQLKNWRDYLDFEISQGDQRRIEFLFERCMVSCALYEDFWTKYCKYAETNIPKRASSIYIRACTIHLQQKPTIHLAWAAFEEMNGSVESARQILADIDRAVPGQVAVRVKRIGLEIRRGCCSEADSLYQESLSANIPLETRNFFTWRYVRFKDKLMQDHAGAVAIMSMAVNMDPSNSRLYLQLLDLYTSGPTHPDMAAAGALFSKVAGSAHLSEEVKESFLARRQQLLEEFGGNFADLRDVTEKFEKAKRMARKRLASEAESDPAKKTNFDPTTPTSAPVGMAQPLTPEQQWAAYQQWSGYTYPQAQQGYSYYPPYSYSQAPATT